MADQMDVPKQDIIEQIEREEESPTENIIKDDYSGVVLASDESNGFNFNVGDTISVHYKITEGSKSRVQAYEGIVIAKKGSGQSKTFTVRRISVGNIGVERIFPIYSPNIESIVLKHKGKVRRAKLYYLRAKVGKAATKVKSA